jgi:hypothetical protein
MATGDAICYHHAAATQALSVGTLAVGTCNQAASIIPGIYLIDSSTPGIGTAVATTAIPDTTTPVVATGTTTGLVAGTIVRIYHAAWPHLTIASAIATTSFTFAATLATASGVVGGAGTYRIVSYDKLYTPRNRVIANITAAATPTVTTLVTHGFTIGQKVRISVPAVCSMTQAHGQTATVLTTPTAVTFTCDLDTTGFTAFTFPTAAQAPCTYAEVTPVGETATITYANLLDDATYNASFLGVRLGTSGTAAIALASPAGTAGDVIKWVAGKSFAYNI